MSRIDPKLKYYGTPCKRGHKQSDGRNVRSGSNGQCIACGRRLPPGIIPDEIGCRETRKEAVDMLTPEKIARSKSIQTKATMKWREAHEPEYRAYLSEYYSRPEVKERVRDYYHDTIVPRIARSPEEEQEHRKKIQRDSNSRYREKLREDPIGWALYRDNMKKRDAMSHRRKMEAKIAMKTATELFDEIDAEMEKSHHECVLVKKHIIDHTLTEDELYELLSKITDHCTLLRVFLGATITEWQQAMNFIKTGDITRSE